MEFTYLDWAATAVPDPDIAEAVRRTALEVYANPSSKHPPGREALRLLEEARSRCGKALDLPGDSLVFTSGGTESNNMVIYSLLNQAVRGGVIVSTLEHPSCGEPVSVLKRFGIRIDLARPDCRALVKPEELELLLQPDTRMVVVMVVHNETGAVQPIEEIVARVRAYQKKGGRSIHIHTDAVQAFGKVPFNPLALGVDSASLSAHKIAGPRGAGLLYLRKPLDFLYRGGGQERGLRSGTENLPGVYGLTLAVEKAVEHFNEDFRHASELNARLCEGLSRIPGASVLPFGREHFQGAYSPWILSASCLPLPGEVLLRILGEKGIAVSTGSACSSRKKAASGIWHDLGVDQKTARSVIRISTGPKTTVGEIDLFLQTLGRITGEGETACI